MSVIAATSNAATPDDRLAALGLSQAILREAILSGEVLRDRCTRHHPPSFPGFVAWGETVRTLGDILVALGWSRRDDDNFSTVLNGGGTIALAVATGDEATGLRGAIPRTKYPKGPTLAAAVKRNNRQLRLFQMADEGTKTSALTWILLVARTRTEVRCELSLPAALGEDRRVQSWRERIILDPITVDGVVLVPLEPTPEIDIPISTRIEA